MKKIIISILIIFFTLLSLTGCSKEQVVIFIVDSVRYNGSGLICQSACSKEYPEDLNTYLSNGWKIKTSTQRAKAQYDPTGNCECIGTEYVLEK